MKYREAYQHFEAALDRAKLLSNVKLMYIWSTSMSLNNRTDRERYTLKFIHIVVHVCQIGVIA